MASYLYCSDTSSNGAGKNSNYGCDGGNTETAYDWVKSNGGLESDSDYPYTSFWDVTGNCIQDTSKNLVSNYTRKCSLTNPAIQFYLST